MVAGSILLALPAQAGFLVGRTPVDVAAIDTDDGSVATRYGIPDGVGTVAGITWDGSHYLLSDPATLAIWEVDDAFMLGAAQLVAPVVEPGARFRKVLLPKGRWYS